MRKRKNTPTPPPGLSKGAPKALRERAKDELRKHHVDWGGISQEETQRQHYELEVHQIELKMQNDELRSTQTDLESARVRYFDLYDLAPVGYITVSEKGIVLEANLAIATLLGTDRSSLVNHPLSRFFVPEDADSYYLFLKKLFTTGEPQTLKLRMKDQNGALIWVQVTATREQEPDGKTVGHIVLTDINELKQTEEALRESEERFRMMANAMAQLAWIAQPDGYIIWYNERWYEYTGTTPVQMEGWGWQSVHDPKALPEVLELWKHSIATGEPFDMEFPLRGADGILRPFLTRGYPLKNKAGSVVQWFGTNTDITERKRAEETLRESAERLQFACRAGGIGIWEFDAVNDRLIWDDQMFRLYGITADRFGGAYEAWRQCLHPDDLQQVESKLQQARSGEKDFETEFRVVWPNGALRTLRASARVLRDASGRPTNLLGTNQDITERKAIEKAQLFLLQCGQKEGEDFFESLAVYLAENLGMDFVCIDKLIGDRLSARTLAMYCDEKFEDNIEYTLQDTPCGDVVGKQVCSFARDVRRLFPKDAALQDLRAESYVGTTLWSTRGEPIGLIAVIGRKPLAETSFTETILKLVSIRAAAEVEHRAAADVLLKANKAYQALSDSGKAIITARSETELLHEAVRIVHEVCGYSLVWIGFAEQDAGKTVSMTVQAGDAKEYLSTVHVTWDDSELGRGPTGTAIRTREPVVNVNTRTTTSLEPWRERQLQFGFLSSAAFPLLAGDEVLGSLTVYANTENAFTNEEIKLLTELSYNLAYGIIFMRMEKERGQAAEILRISNARLDILAETASQLLKTDSPQQEVDTLCRRVMAFLDCQAFFNFLADEERGQLHLNACAGIPPEEAAKIEWLDYGIAVCGCAARDGCRIVAEDILNTPDIRTELVKSYGIQAYACHPLLTQGEVIGTLSFGTRTRARFTDDELSLMKAVADQVAIAIKRNLTQNEIARLYRNLHRKAQELEAVFNTVPVGIAIADDPEGFHIRGNPANDRMLGLPPGAEHSLNPVPGRAPASYRVLQNGQELPVRKLPMQRAARGEIVAGQLIDIVRQDGRTLNLYSNAVPLFDEQGQPRGAVGAFLDITELKQAEEALQFYLERLDTLIKVSAAIIAETTAAGALRRSADAARELTGARVAVTGHGFLHGHFKVGASSQAQDMPPCPEGTQFAIQKGGVYLDIINRGETICFTDQEMRSHPAWWGMPGEHSPLRGLCGVPLTTADGSTNGLIMVSDKTGGDFTGIDISLLAQLAAITSLALQHIEAHDEIEKKAHVLKDTNEQLEEEIRRRTLAEQILLQYADDLAMSNEELESFASAVSHDLQEPLRSIAGFIRLLDKKYGSLLDSRGKEYIERSIASSMRLGGMINSLLSYSRITTRGKKFAYCELEDIMATAIDNLNATISQTKALITREPLPRVYGDSDQLLRVFQNLIGNSIKYCGTRRPEIHVSSQRGEDTCTIAVRDNGVGIEPQYIKNIFDMFTRGFMDYNISGTGMGLALCKKIIGRHRGKIWAESEPGKGSTFFFSIPQLYKDT